MQGVGSIPPLAEAQARYYALLLSGKRSLPSTMDMLRTIERDDAAIVAQYPWDARRIEPLCDFLRLLDDLAKLIGCVPNSIDIFRPFLSYKILFGPLTGAQYRLRGPHAMPSVSRKAILRTPTSPLPLVLFNFVNLTIHNDIIRTFLMISLVHAAFSVGTSRMAIS